MSGTCEARIYERNGVTWHRCERRATGERQGRPVCTQHLRTRYAPYWIEDREVSRGDG